MMSSASIFRGFDNIVWFVTEQLTRASQKKPKSYPTSLRPPWTDWKLDKEFFDALSQWTAAHPESTLDRVLDNVRDAINNRQPFMGLIPDNPFPARGLVEALAHLVRLGLFVARAKAEVQAFAVQIVHWVMNVKSTFENHNGGKFALATWRNLGNMRDLVDEICMWANTRLTDRRWSRIGHGLTIAKEIDEFKSRITEAQRLFSDLSMITLSGGIDSIFQELMVIFRRQDTILKEVKKIRKIQEGQLQRIIDEMDARTQAEARRAFLAETLAPRAVANPSYSYQGRQPCDEDTRVEVLADILKWVEDVSEHSQNFLWLTGDPGCGKSAITASIASECKDRHVLWAQFFINRSNIETTDPNSYFPTIAHQLADRSMDVECAIYDALRMKPSLVDRISANQAAKLFVDVIGVASELDPMKPVVVVIDGLDETDRQHLKDTAIIFSQLFRSLPRHRNAKVFISSRTEDDIRNPFARNLKDEHVRHIHLDTSSASSLQDVSLYLRRKISQLVEENDLNWAVWPGEERMAVLATRAAGLFIWAVTVVKFLQGQIDVWGTECLSDVLDALNSDGMGDINRLYNIILWMSYQDQVDVWAFETFRRIVGAIVVLHEPICLSDLSDLLNLRRSTVHSPVDIQRFVRRLRTVLVAGTDAIDGKTLPRLHKSFFEFITSERVEPRFRIDPYVANGEVALQCLRHFTGAHAMLTGQSASLKSDSPGITSLPGPVRYALKFWFLHLPRMDGVAAGAALVNSTMELDDFEYLLQHSSNSNHVGPLALMFSSDNSKIVTTTTDNPIRQWDATSGKELELALDCHKGAVLSVAFSPDGEQVASASSDNTARVQNTRTGIGWSFVGHTDSVAAIAFSPDSKQIVSGSSDRTVRLWNIETGEQIGTPFIGHDLAVTCIAFSRQGKYIASGSDDATVCIWDMQTGQPSGTPFHGHISPVTSVTFSPDGQLVLSSSEDCTLRLRDVKTRKLIHIFHGHSRSVTHATFSPDGQKVVSASLDNTILLWDCATGLVLGRPFEGHTDLVRSVIFSLDGKNIISASRDRTIHTWNIKSYKYTGSSFTSQTYWVTSVSFSNDRKRLASGSTDGIIRISDLGTQHEKHLSVDFTAFSPDRKQAVIGFSDSTLRIWRSSLHGLNGSVLEGDIRFAGLSYRSVIFSPNGMLIAATTFGHNVYLWDQISCRLIHSHSFTSGQEMRISFTSDSKRLIAISGGDAICVWSADSGQLRAVGRKSGLHSYDDVDILLDKKLTGRRFDTPNRDVRWFSTAGSGSTFTAYVDGHIIVGRKQGPVTVVPAFPLHSNQQV